MTEEPEQPAVMRYAQAMQLIDAELARFPDSAGTAMADQLSVVMGLLEDWAPPEREPFAMGLMMAGQYLAAQAAMERQAPHVPGELSGFASSLMYSYAVVLMKSGKDLWVEAGR